MLRSSNYNFYLPEAITTDGADIEQVSENFAKLDTITKTPSVIQTNGAANAYQISLPVKQLNNDVRIIFIPLYNNTGASTLEILGHNGVSLGVKKIVNAEGVQISTVDMILAKKLYLLTYDAAADGGAGAFVIADIIVPADGSITDDMIGERTVNPELEGGDNTGKITQLLSWMARQIAAITGLNWYDTVLKSFKDIFEADGMTAKKATLAATATLAEAAKGDKRFPITMHIPLGVTIPANNIRSCGRLAINLLPGQKLVLKGMRAIIHPQFRFFVGYISLSNPLEVTHEVYTMPGDVDTVFPNVTLFTYDESYGMSGRSHNIFFCGARNIAAYDQSANDTFYIWLDLAIENV
jgi:hypothetical protein